MPPRAPALRPSALPLRRWRLDSRLGLVLLTAIIAAASSLLCAALLLAHLGPAGSRAGGITAAPPPVTRVVRVRADQVPAIIAGSGGAEDTSAEGMAAALGLLGPDLETSVRRFPPAGPPEIVEVHQQPRASSGAGQRTLIILEY